MRSHWAATRASDRLPSVFTFIFGGSIPRIGYLVHLGVYALAGTLVAWPGRTFIWTSPALLADAYPYFALSFLCFLGIGFVSSYLKTCN